MYKPRSLSWDLFTGLFRPPENFQMNVVVFFGVRVDEMMMMMMHKPRSLSWDLFTASAKMLLSGPRGLEALFGKIHFAGPTEFSPRRGC